MSRTRAKNLSDRSIEAIVSLLDAWSGRLSWDLLIEAIERRLFVCYTRQALHRHERIRLAFARRKETPSVRGGAAKRKDVPHEQVMLDRIALLEATNARLREENERLLEQFTRWAYNAFTRGVDVNLLNLPLPIVDRGQTKK